MKHHREFQYLYIKGRSQHSGSVVLFYLPSDKIRKVGFTATKKIGNAVHRNRAKRRMRALFYQFSPQLKSGTYVFVAKAAMVEKSYQQLQSDFKRVLSRAKAIA
ncbi:MAG: ribonuclease P protein component [Epsilonproteobacteria bacterium]|nr:ribonuclease P protein component [Campylobacterota bacterium]